MNTDLCCSCEAAYFLINLPRTLLGLILAWLLAAVCKRLEALVRCRTAHGCFWRYESLGHTGHLGKISNGGMGICGG